MPSTLTKIARPIRRAGVGRKRAEPDQSTYEGRLCARLNALVEARGWTPQEFADKVGVGKSMAYHWLSGRGVPAVNDWPKIAKVLRVEIAELLPPK